MSRDLDLTKYQALSFDCYGTLIDWETGIAAVLAPWAREQGLSRALDATLPTPGVERRGLLHVAQSLSTTTSRPSAKVCRRVALTAPIARSERGPTAAARC